MIDEIVKIHDRYQFEVKLEYNMNAKKSATSYHVDTYLFMPRSLDIKKNTYHRNSFYNDIQTYVRFKTPVKLLKNIVSGKGNPLELLQSSIEKLTGTSKESRFDRYEHQVKMLCCMLKSSVRDHVVFMYNQQNAVDMATLIDQYTESVKNITCRYRQLRELLNLPGIGPKAFSTYCFGDEYISYLIEDYSYELLNFIKMRKNPELVRHETQLLSLIKEEISHRKESGYPGVPLSEDSNEELIYRKSALKKYVARALFLNTRLKEDGRLAEQVVFGIAAGLSMLFATCVAFFYQSRYGNLTFPFFVALIISYMVKDRIKELLRAYFSSILKHWFFDQRMKIYRNEDEPLGVLKESFDFIDEHRLPKDVADLRKKDPISEIDGGWAGESVMHYRKYIKISNGALGSMYQNYKINAINDITRFSIINFLGKTGNPRKDLYALSKDGYEKIYGERTYRLNMIVRYTSNDQVTCKKFRIIFNRNGIKRIEQVDNLIGLTRTSHSTAGPALADSIRQDSRMQDIKN